jgi:hypothetical protein
LAAFEGLTSTGQPVATVLYGPVQDQAALYGLLDRIQSLGLELVEIRQLPQHPRSFLTNLSDRADAQLGQSGHQLDWR